MDHYYLACDLGAESGRLIAGCLSGEQLRLEEIHRFHNGAVPHEGSLHWDIPKLVGELKVGLRKTAALRLPFESISTDSWGVDYLFIDPRGQILQPVYHYRDARSVKGVSITHSRVSQDELYQETGIQFMALNTVFQLATESSERLAAAGRLLTIADAFNFLLSGVEAIEISNASTTALYNPVNRTWSTKLLERLGFPTRIFPPLVEAGTRLGALTSAWSAETGLGPIEVIATCSHDTGAAVAAVPVLEGNRDPSSSPTWAYLSSGTWSLLGAEISAPLINPDSQHANFTNEVGYGNRIRLLKNIVGLWLVQECRREWSRAGDEFTYDELTALASDAPPFRSWIDPVDPRFLEPGDMPRRIADFCKETGQSIPGTVGGVVRCCLESLARTYAEALQDLESVVRTKITRLHVVGGGSRNPLLNQMTADACGIPILAGPVEATALGNVIVQAIAQRHLPDLESARALIQRSFPCTRYAPSPCAKWQTLSELRAQSRASMCK